MIPPSEATRSDDTQPNRPANSRSDSGSPIDGGIDFDDSVDSSGVAPAPDDYKFGDEFDASDLEAIYFQDDIRPELFGAQAQASQVIQLLRLDCEFFIEFFLGEQLDLEVPQLHKDVWELMTDEEKERVLLAIPRDHAKTTLAKLVVIWYWLFTYHRFCVYLSNTNPIAKGACKDILGFLKHPNFVEVFGEVNWIKESDTESLWIFEITIGGKVKRCILRAVGQGQQMRGINIDNQRPDIAVVDDVEDNENTDSEYLQKKLDKWIFGPFLKALARRKKILWLGNMLQKTSLLARLSSNPRWNPVVFGALVQDSNTGQLTPLWPGKWSVEALIEDFEEYKALGLMETWMCEMMNMPGHGEDGFTQDMIHYVTPKLAFDMQCTWITIDPAFGEDQRNDSTAIVVHGLPIEGPPQVCEHICAQMSEAEIFENAFSLASRWGAWVWGVEAVAAQRVLISLFKILEVGKRLNHMIEYIPLISGKGDSKVSRISSWVSLMANREEGRPSPKYGIPEGDVELTTAILRYNKKKKSQADDLIDACAYGPQILEQYLPLLIESFNGNMASQTHEARWGTEVCGV